MRNVASNEIDCHHMLEQFHQESAKIDFFLRLFFLEFLEILSQHFAYKVIEELDVLGVGDAGRQRSSSLHLFRPLRNLHQIVHHARVGNQRVKR